MVVYKVCEVVKPRDLEFPREYHSWMHHQLHPRGLCIEYQPYTNVEAHKHSAGIACFESVSEARRFATNTSGGRSWSIIEGVSDSVRAPRGMRQPIFLHWPRVTKESIQFFWKRDLENYECFYLPDGTKLARAIFMREVIITRLHLERR